MGISGSCGAAWRVPGQPSQELEEPDLRSPLSQSVGLFCD